jgi:hypothetical protein
VYVMRATNEEASRNVVSMSGSVLAAISVAGPVPLKLPLNFAPVGAGRSVGSAE